MIGEVSARRPSSRPRGAVIVTGGASGLGRATAMALRSEGAVPIVFDVSEPPFAVEHEVVDVADRAVTEAAVDRIARRHGAIVAVVTCAGIDACGRLDEVQADAWERVIEVNLVGTVTVIRAALPHLERARGRIVTVASTLGLRALPEATAYCASKFGVVGFTRALALEMAGRVGVTLLVPGGMATSFFDGRIERYRPGPDTQLNRPESVASAVLFAIRQPAGCELRELVITPSLDSSY